jgi:hypothetical protein
MDAFLQQAAGTVIRVSWAELGVPMPNTQIGQGWQVRETLESAVEVTAVPQVAKTTAQRVGPLPGLRKQRLQLLFCGRCLWSKPWQYSCAFCTKQSQAYLEAGSDATRVSSHRCATCVNGLPEMEFLLEAGTEIA